MKRGVENDEKNERKSENGDSSPKILKFQSSNSSSASEYNHDSRVQVFYFSLWPINHFIILFFKELDEEQELAQNLKSKILNIFNTQPSFTLEKL